MTKRSHSALLKRRQNVQDCLHRPRLRRHFLRPVDGLHRPPADRQRAHLDSQWRPSPFRSLSPLRHSPDCVFRLDHLRFPPRLKAPVFRGLFFDALSGAPVSIPGQGSNCDKSPELCFGVTIRLQYWHIAYQYASKRSDQQTRGAIRRMICRALRRQAATFAKPVPRFAAHLSAVHLSERRGCCDESSGLHFKFACNLQCHLQPQR
jgi:hypothetical protein